MKKPTKPSKIKYYPYLTKDNVTFDVWTRGFINVLYGEGWINPMAEEGNMECRRDYYEDGLTPYEAYQQELIDGQ